MRYLVERKHDDFEDVGADEFEIGSSGALVFRKREGSFTEFVIAYAPGQWVTVCEAAE